MEIKRMEPPKPGGLRVNARCMGACCWPRHHCECCARRKHVRYLAHTATAAPGVAAAGQRTVHPQSVMVVSTQRQQPSSSDGPSSSGSSALACAGSSGSSSSVGGSSGRSCSVTCEDCDLLSSRGSSGGGWARCTWGGGSRCGMLRHCTLGCERGGCHVISHTQV